MSWKNIKIKDIPEIDKVVAEFEIGEVKKHHGENLELKY